MSSILTLITARGGSKTIEKKNIALVGGRPLIAWSIATATQAALVDRVVVSTDDPEIAAIAEQWGAEIPFMRPGHLARDDSPHIPVLQHAIAFFRDCQGVTFDYLLLLQPTSPLLEPEDIDNAVSLADAAKAAAVVSVCEAFSHPYFLKTIDDQGALRDYCAKPGGYQPKQILPPVYFENGALYLVQCELLMNTGSLFPTGTIPYIMPQSRSLQVDSRWELELVDILLRRRHGKNEAHDGS